MGYANTPDQVRAVEGLVAQIARVSRESVQEGWTRGRKTLYETLRGLSGACVDPLAVPAQAVTAERISVLAQAGASRPDDQLASD